MPYAIEVTEDTSDFIGKMLNGGVDPEKIENNRTFFVFDDQGQQLIMTMDQMVDRYPNLHAVKRSTLFSLT